MIFLARDKLKLIRILEIDLQEQRHIQFLKGTAGEQSLAVGSRISKESLKSSMQLLTYDRPSKQHSSSGGILSSNCYFLGYLVSQEAENTRASCLAVFTPVLGHSFGEGEKSHLEMKILQVLYLSQNKVYAEFLKVRSPDFWEFPPKPFWSLPRGSETSTHFFCNDHKVLFVFYCYVDICTIPRAMVGETADSAWIKAVVPNCASIHILHYHPLAANKKMPSHLSSQCSYG